MLVCKIVTILGVVTISSATILSSLPSATAHQALTLLAFAVSTLAQIPNLPSCAQNCVKLPAGCQTTDFKCICGNKDFISTISCCVSTSCQRADQATVIKFAQGLCGGYGVTVSSQAVCASGTSGGAVVSSKSTTSGKPSVTSTPNPSRTSSPMISTGPSTSAVGSTATSGVSTVSGSASSAGSSISPSTTAVDVKSDVNGSFNNKQLIPIQDPLLKALVDTAIKIPDHFNVSCKTCSTTGSVEVAAGGWSPDGNDISDAASNFTKQGWIKVMIRDLSMQLEPVISLLPGFQLVNIEVPVYTKRLGTVNFTKKGNAAMDFNFAIKLPLIVELHSEVDISPKLKVEVPNDASIFIDMSNNNIYGGSKQSGFEKTKATPGFNLNAPNLNFTIVEGVNVYLSANASAPKPIGDLGKVEIKAKLPQFNSTFAWLNNVNDRCVPPSSGQQSFANALGAKHVGAYDISWSGNIKSVNKGGDIKNDSLTLADGCYTWDANAKSLKVATSAGASLTPALDMIHMLGLGVIFSVVFMV